MGLLDRWAKRKGYIHRDQLKGMTRKFHAANVNRLTSGWQSTVEPIDFDLRRGLTTLVGRARDLAKNNNEVRRYLGMVKSNVIGPEGITMQAKILDENGNPDEAANEAIEAAWCEWCKYGSPDITGTMSWVDLQRLYVESTFRDGEALVRMHRGFPHNKHQFALQMMDTMLLDPDHNQPYQGRVVKMGVELSKRYRRPTAYWVIDSEADHPDQLTYNNKKYVRLPEKQILHRFLPEYVYQTRGFPHLVSAMYSMQQLAAYQEAAITEARVSASVMGFFTKNSENMGYSGDATDSTGNLIMQAEPGTFEQLPDGVDFKVFDPKQPAAEYAQFVKANLRSIASGLGVSYNSLANDLENVNFSSIRSGVLEDRELWKAIQQWTIETFCKPVFDSWFDMARVSNSILIDGRPLRRPDSSFYKQVQWRPRRWSWVDPLKDMKANIAAINQGLRSRSDVIRESGADPEEVWREIQREKVRMEELGIELTAQEEGDLETYDDGDPNN